MTATLILERPCEPGQADRRILLISYHFPPDASIGARRWERIAPFIAAKGWGLDVITCMPPPGSDRRRLEALPPGVRVYGIPPVVLGVEKLELSAWRLYSTLHRAARRLNRLSAAGSARTKEDVPGRAELVERGDVRWVPSRPRDLLRVYWTLSQHSKFGRWACLAATEAQAVADPTVHIAVVTSGPPHRTHDAGRMLSHRTGIPFVMDLRDPWSLSERVHEGVASPLWFRLARTHEKLAVGQAALVVANTDLARDALAAAYPDAASRIIAVMNGSDEDPLPPPTYSQRFTIAYTGTIYVEQHPRNLFRAASSVIRELSLRPDEFGIDFLGNGLPGRKNLRELAQEEGIVDFVTAQPSGTHAEALAFQARAPMHVTFPGWDTTTIPAKIFECVRFNAWLLAIAIPGSACARALQQTNADVVPPDPAAIAAVIRRRYQLYRGGTRPGPIVTDDRLSRRGQARILLDAIGHLGTPSPDRIG